MLLEVDSEIIVAPRERKIPDLCTRFLDYRILPWEALVSINRDQQRPCLWTALVNEPDLLNPQWAFLTPIRFGSDPSQAEEFKNLPQKSYLKVCHYEKIPRSHIIMSREILGTLGVESFDHIRY